MGIEAFILPWLFAMSLVALIGGRSVFLDLRTKRSQIGVVELADGRRSPVRYWMFVALKLSIVLFACMQIVTLLKRGI